jgi:zinc resistance-associated protein
MWKSPTVLAAVLVIGGLSVVHAQQQYGRDDDGAIRWHQRNRMSAEDRAAFLDARIAGLKVGLELTPDQAKNWPAPEQPLRERAQLRAQLD